MIIIPARINSSRFPRKVLVDILGTPMVIRVAKQASLVDDVIVATDCDEVIDVCSKHDIKAVLTSTAHQSGTDRIYEVAKSLGLSPSENIINLQADEPFIEKDVLIAIEKKTSSIKQDMFITSCFTKINKSQAVDTNNVKVTMNKYQQALYFSRSLIPYDRDDGFDDYSLHLGIYGFNVASLKMFCEIKHSTLEHIEKLEQLRWLENGYDIFMQEVETRSFGIDSPEDLERAIKIFNGVPENTK